jgi:hypothetical protein
MARSKVLLPQADGPISETNSPADFGQSDQKTQVINL